MMCCFIHNFCSISEHVNFDQKRNFRGFLHTTALSFADQGKKRHVSVCFLPNDSFTGLFCCICGQTVHQCSQATNTRTRLTALCPGLPRSAGIRKVKPIWILLKQETVSGSGISWAMCKSASRSRQITTPALHHPETHTKENWFLFSAARCTSGNSRKLVGMLGEW